MGRNGIHAPFSETIVLNAIAPLAPGLGSLDLADGQIGLFQDKTSQRGLVSINDVTTLKGKKKIYLEVGTGIKGSSGGYSRKGMRSVAFYPEDVLDVQYSPALPPTQGEVILGYDGLDTEKSISLAPGESSQIHIRLTGDPIAFYGFNNGVWEHSFAFSQPDVGDCADECVEGACYDVVKNLAITMKDHMMRENIYLRDLLDIRFLSTCSDEPTPTITAQFYELRIQDTGDAKALAYVQGQVPGYEVVRIDRDEAWSTYQIVKTDGSGLPSAFVEWTRNLLTDCAGACPAGYTLSEGGFLYSISWEDEGVDEGSTVVDSAIGIAEVADAGGIFTVSTPTVPDGARTPGTYTGVTQTATTGAGTGATFTIVIGAGGSVDSITVTDDGSGYIVTEQLTIADADLGGGGGADVLIDVDSIATVVTIAKVGQQYGAGKYALVSPTELTQAQIDNFIAVDATIQFDETPVEVADVCTPDTSPSTAWTVGDTCDVAERTFIIQLPDDECDGSGTSRLAELQANYPTLTIVEVGDPAPANCMRQYSTTVISNMVCAECRPDLYRFEAPDDYEFASWKEVLPNPTVSGTDSVDCACGISIKGQAREHCPPGHHQDQIGTINGQLRVEISGGELLGHKIGYKYKTDPPFPVTRVSRAFDGSGFGFTFTSREKESYERYLAVNSGRDWAEQWHKGNETKLDPCTQYDTISVKLKRAIPAQSMSKTVTEIFRYVFVIPPGSRDLYTAFFTAVAGANPDAVSFEA